MATDKAAREAAAEIKRRPAWRRPTRSELEAIIQQAIDTETQALQERHKAQITHVRQGRTAWKARAIAAEAIVEKLPKTVDEVPITLRTTFWYEQGKNCRGNILVTEIHFARISGRITTEHGVLLHSVKTAELFSTREAAEAAKVEQ